MYTGRILPEEDPTGGKIKWEQGKLNVAPNKVQGSCIGPHDARFVYVCIRIGLSGTTQASVVDKTIGKFGFQCGN
uniref:Uncharacterized protein n=1 Tax=Salix viminalis TaxID=40686 RepID=A0A6N2N3A2_SALVM